MRSRPGTILTCTLLCAVGAALVGCTTTGPKPDASQPNTAASSEAPVLNPLTAITDPASTDFVSSNVDVVLNEAGRGGTTFTVERPDSSVKAIRYYVACTPESPFKVTMGTFFSGDCAPRFQNSGEIPLAAVKDPGPLTVKLDLPEGVDYSIVAIAITKGAQ